VPATRRGRSLYLIHGEDPYRARLRAAELVAALASGDERPSDLRTRRSTDLGSPLGLSRHDAREAGAAALIELSGRSQGLFDAVDEQRIVVVEHAEALKETDVVSRFPPEAALVLVSEAKIQTRTRRAAPKAKPTPDATAADLPAVVEAAGGAIEHIARLLPQELGGWIAARATLLGVEVGLVVGRHIDDGRTFCAAANGTAPRVVVSLQCGRGPPTRGRRCAPDSVSA
jgi:predicted nicotinamide N-methyase